MKKISIFLLSALLLLLCSCADTGYDHTAVPETLASETENEGLAVSLPEPYPADTRLTFVGCGDNIMYQGNLSDAKKLAAGTDKEYDFSPIYENVKHVIESADLAFINQETPMAGEDFGYDDYPRFNSPRQLAYDLMDTGFDIVNLATNHMLDAGSAGLLETIKFWNTLPVTTIGGYLDSEDFENIRIVERDGIKIALLSFTYSTNNLKLREGYDIVIPYEDSETILRMAEKAEELADLTIVSMHWGNEYSFKASANQKSLASMMSGVGVDVIIGHHPHVLQPIEWVESPTGNGHKLLCAYSLGNFAAEQANDYNYVGGILKFDIVREKGEVYVENPILLPTVYYFNRAFRQNSVHLMENFTEDMAKSHGIAYYGKSTNVTKLRSYVTNTVAKEFLPDYLK